MNRCVFYSADYLNGGTRRSRHTLHETEVDAIGLKITSYLCCVAWTRNNRRSGFRRFFQKGPPSLFKLWRACIALRCMKWSGRRDSNSRRPPWQRTIEKTNFSPYNALTGTSVFGVLLHVFSKTRYYCVRHNGISCLRNMTTSVLLVVSRDVMKSAFYRTVTLAAILIIVLWFFTVENNGFKFTPDTLEPLFTGLAFVAVLATFIHERQQARDKENEHQELLREMRAQIREMRAQVKATCHAARISALTAAIAVDRAELEKFNLTGVLMTSGSGLQAKNRMSEIEARLRGNEKGLRDAATLTEIM